MTPSTPADSGKPRHLVLLYHFFHPDDVISARLFSDLAEAMAERGWEVTAMPGTRLFESNRRLPNREQWHGVSIRRVWRPGLKQSSNLGRVVNALTLLIMWTWRAAIHRRHPNETMIVGTDPIMSILVAIPWRLFRPKSRIIHWCHDLHPEASIADGVIQANAWYVKLLRKLLATAYRRCDVIVDLGNCMRSSLKQDAALSHEPTQQFTTITPWALVEPESTPATPPATRQELFGDCALSCLYSGNLGRAHEYEQFLELARRTRQHEIHFCFAGRGARMSQLKQSVSEADSNLHFADFAAEDQLNNRLASGDIHLVSLREDWTGTVVPSKFFGSLAMGRPVIFVGSANCAIAGWINQFQVGWHLTSYNVDQVAEQLRALSEAPDARLALNQHCLDIYRKHFSRQAQLTRWESLINA